MKYMKLSEWAKINGVCYKTAWRWFCNGTLPVQSKQLKTGTILVENDENISIPDKTVIYNRVSNHSHKDELEHQTKRCEDFCLKNGWVVNKVYKEIASGLNEERRQLWLMIDSKPTRIVVENKDRLSRFGFTYFKKFLNEKGCQIIVIHEEKEDQSDIVKDLVSIIYSFCAKLYGMRRAYNKTIACKKALKIK